MAILAPTSVRELVAQGLSPLEIKHKAEEYAAQGQTLWGWPEYRLWHFYNPRTNVYYAHMCTPATFKIPVITTTKPERVQATPPVKKEAPVKRERRVVGPWEEALAIACRLAPSTPVAQYINELPPQQRKCVRLKYKLSKTNEEVAKECGKALSTINTTLSQAYSRIRRMHRAKTGGVLDD